MLPPLPQPVSHSRRSLPAPSTPTEPTLLITHPPCLRVGRAKLLLSRNGRTPKWLGRSLALPMRVTRSTSLGGHRAIGAGGLGTDGKVPSSRETARRDRNRAGRGVEPKVYTRQR